MINEALALNDDSELIINTTPKSQTIPGLRKAAILCLVMGEEFCSELFKHLGEEEIQNLTKEIASVSNISSKLGDRIIQEFFDIYTAQTYVLAGGVDFAKKLLFKSFPADQAKKLLDRINRSIESSVGFQALQKVSPQQLAKLIQNEHPQTVVVVLAHLDATAAAEALSHLPEARRADLMLRLANLQTISQDVIRGISVLLEKKLKNIGNYSQQPIGGVRTVAELCNRLDREMSRKMLEEIEINDPQLALSVRDLMVTFDDLLLIDDMGIREILKRVDKKVLTLALKAAIPEMQARFFANMSSRAVEMMKEDLEYLGQIKMKEVAEAQRQVVNVMRELDEQGIISLSGGGDEYV